MSPIGPANRLRPAAKGFAGSMVTSRPAPLRGGVDVGDLGCRIWWHGYLANRTALLDQLDHHLERSVSDERLIALAYRRWGADLQGSLIGEYAVAIFDRTTNSLVLTHDALGVVPMYYSTRGQAVFFGTHLSMIAELMINPEFDDSYLAEFLLRGRCLGERTIYRDIKRLGIGTTAEYRAGAAVERRTWRLGDIPELRYRDPRDYDEHFRELIGSAVATAVDGRTWSELSGGLDSSTIVCTADKLGVQDLETVSVIYPRSTTADERSWIEIVGAQTGLAGHLIDGDEHRPFSVLPNRAVEEPSRLHMMWPVFSEYEQLLRTSGVDVLLSGFGGDQVLFGRPNYPLHAADRIRHLRLVSAVGQVARWPTNTGDRSVTHRVLTTAAIPAWHYLRGHLLRFEYERAVPHCPWVSRDLLQRTSVGDGAVGAPRPRMPTVRGQAYYERIWQIACATGQFWGHNSTASRWRYPLLYRPLVEFMYSLPWQQQVPDGQDRALHRRALAGTLPEQIRMRRTKSGPDQAVYEGLRTNRAVFEMLTARPLIAQRGYVDPEAWRTAMRAAQFGHVDSAPRFEAAVSLEIWLRQQENQL